MDIKIEASALHPTAHICGELGADATEAFVEQLHTHVSGEGARLVVDLSGVTAINSQGLSAIISLATRAKLAGGQVVLASPTPFVAEVLRVTNLDSWFDICDSVEQAYEKVATV